MAGQAGCSDDDLEKYQNDSRTACKYGEKCYQKNPQHHKRFKHPPKRKLEEKEEEKSKKEEIPNAAKRLRRDDPNTTDANNLDDAVVPEINDQPTLLELSKLEEEGQPYLRTKIPKPNNATEESDDKDKNATEETEEAPEDTLGQDYIVQDSPTNIKYSIEQKFLLEMPDDFFDLWECCSKIDKEKPEEALKKAGLTLVGPYDVLTGKLKQLKTRRVSSYVCHWRYYYDPPEFMTVIAGDENEFHIGYYRDDPFHMPVFVASMSDDKPGHIKPLGENIFAAVCSYLNQRLKEENPFKKMPLQRLHREVESYAKSHDYSLDPLTANMKRRKKKVVSNTFHGAGIVVPVHNDVGYREIPETNANLRRMFQKVRDSKTEEERTLKFDEIQELITNVQFAYDEGDYGMGLELGMNMFVYGGEEFHKAIFHLLGVGYDLLGREPYVDIIHAHLKNRRKGSNMSILEVID